MISCIVISFLSCGISVFPIFAGSITIIFILYVRMNIDTRVVDNNKWL